MLELDEVTDLLVTAAMTAAGYRRHDQGRMEAPTWLSQGRQ